jgi:Recombinase zinc beta ribbon domain
VCSSTNHTPPRKGRRLRDRADWIPVDIPAIVTPERHAAALAALARNGAHLVGRPACARYELRGLLRCSLCGHRYVSCPNHGRRYYRCYAHNRQVVGARCRAPSISATVAEADVWRAISAALRRPEALREAMELFETSQGARDAEVRSKIEAITKKLRSVETKERRLLDLYLEEGLATAEVTARLRTITKERSALTAERERAVAQAAELGATVDRAAWIERWSTEAAKGLDDLDDLGRQRFLQAVVDEIIVKPDRTLEIRGLIPAEASAQVSSQPSTGFGEPDAILRRREPSESRHQDSHAPLSRCRHISKRSAKGKTSALRSFDAHRAVDRPGRYVAQRFTRRTT